MKYYCEYCDFNIGSQTSLKLHVRVKHDGIRYPCDECKYKATTAGNLLKHTRKMHETVNNFNSFLDKLKE